MEDMGPDAVYDDDRQHRIVLHKKAAGQAVEVSTEFINDSAEAVTLEMLSSFAIRGINADRIHRLQSFWSAEGKLRTESIEELHFEPSWNRCGIRVENSEMLVPCRFLVVEDSKKQEFLGIQLYCPSSWQIEILCKDSATYAIFRLWLLSETRHNAITKLRAQPQPPRNTKVSRKVLEKISVG